jgi:hypothetical protein
MGLGGLFEAKDLVALPFWARMAGCRVEPLARKRLPVLPQHAGRPQQHDAA